MVCKACGANVNLEDGIFCPYCGTRLNVPSDNKITFMGKGSTFKIAFPIDNNIYMSEVKVVEQNHYVMYNPMTMQNKVKLNISFESASPVCDENGKEITYDLGSRYKFQKFDW